MALRPMLLAAVVGVTALGTLYAPAARAEGYFSISIGAPGPYYGRDYGRGYDAGYVWVSAHWVLGDRGRVWVPGRYVRAGAYYDRGYNRGYRYDRGYRHGHHRRVIYHRAPIHPLPGAFYYQRGGNDYPRSYYPPRDHRAYRGW